MSARDLPSLLCRRADRGRWPPAAGDPLSGNCRLADQPAATLLIPYFEVDLDDPSGPDTLVSVNNASAKPALARVVLWTDWGVPTLAFDVYLTGYDVQTLNLRDLFAGIAAADRTGSSTRGSLSESADPLRRLRQHRRPASAAARRHRARPGCAPPIPAGRCPAQPGHACAGGARRRPQLATGYITVDTVNRCSPGPVGTLVNTPADRTYFARRRRRPGERRQRALGRLLLRQLERQHGRQPDGGRDRRRPRLLPGRRLHLLRPLRGLRRRATTGLPSPASTTPATSTAAPSPAAPTWWSGATTARPRPAPRACGRRPPGRRSARCSSCSSTRRRTPGRSPHSNAFPLDRPEGSRRRRHPAGAAPFGWTMLDLWHRDAAHAQGWVTVLMTAEGRFTAGHAALRADDLCNFGP